MTCDICNVNAQNNLFDLASSTVLYKNNAKTLGKPNYYVFETNIALVLSQKTKYINLSMYNFGFSYLC